MKMTGKVFITALALGCLTDGAISAGLTGAELVAQKQHIAMVVLESAADFFEGVSDSKCKPKRSAIIRTI